MEDEMLGSARWRGTRETLAAVVFVVTFLASVPTATGTLDQAPDLSDPDPRAVVPRPPANLTVNGFAAGSPGSMGIVPPVSTLTWDHVDPNGSPQSAFRVEVRNAPNGTGFIFDYRDGLGNSSSYVFGSSGNSTNLSRGSTYYFRVRTQAQGNWSNFSEMRFRINTQPTMPSNIDPSNGQLLPLSPAQRVRWSPSYDSQNDTILYEWIVDLSRPPTTPHLANGTSANLTSDPFPTRALLTYYWYVRAFDGYEHSGWSNFANGTDFTVYQPNRAPFVDPANLSLPSFVHPAVFESATVLYEDPDGPYDLSTAWLRVSAGAQNFTLRGINGTSATSLPSDIFGQGVRIARYDRTSGPSGLSITWRFVLDWTWISSGPLLFEARALDRSASGGAWVGGTPVPFERYLSTFSSSPARVQLRVGETATFNGTFGFANVGAPFEYFENLSVRAALDALDGPAVDSHLAYDRNYSLRWGPLAGDVGVHQLYITARRDGVAPPDSAVYWTRIQVEVLPGIAPFVVSASPEEGADVVSLQPAVRITFSAEMNATTTIAAVQLVPDVPGSVVQIDGRTLTIERMGLRANTNYLVRVVATATDANGTPMSADFVLRFRTQSTGGDPLTELTEVFLRNPLILFGLAAVLIVTMVLTGFLSRRRRSEAGGPPAPIGGGYTPLPPPPGSWDQTTLSPATDSGALPSGGLGRTPQEARAALLQEDGDPSRGLGPLAREPGSIEREEGPLAPTEPPIVAGGPDFHGGGTTLAPAAPASAAAAVALSPSALAAARLAVERKQKENETATVPAVHAAPAGAIVAVEAALKEILPGNNYLLLHEHDDPALRVAARTVLRGGRAMIITHIAPVKLRRQFFLPRGVMVMWLTDMEDAPGGINPKRMEFELAKAMLTFIREGDGGVLVIDCFEHLVQENGFERSFASLKRVLDASSESGATVIAVMNSKSLGERIADVRTAFDKIIETA